MSLFKKAAEKVHAIPVKQFAPGEIVIRENDRAACMFNILSGSVAVYQHYGTPTQKLIATLKKGEYFGEMAVIESQPRNATIVAVDASVVQVISSDDFYQYIRENPDQVALMLQKMGKRIHTANDELLDACETIWEIEQCRAKNEEPGPDLASRIRVYSGRYSKNK